MNRKIYEEFAAGVDCGYSYRFAKKMEENASNPKLGYRTACSDAELATAELIAEEMRKIGLTNVTKDRISVDGWEFTRADMRFTDGRGEEHLFTLGAYQTNFDTEGEREFSVVYVGKGRAKDYEGKDVTDKLVLADIDQRNEWWISYPVYQAYLKGAAAFIAIQSGGYGEISDIALNAQDIGGPDYAPAFSISRRDAELLKWEIAQNGEARVVFDAKSEVWRNGTTYNVWGEIEGEDKDSAVLLSAHFDSYFSGFQDDNSAIAMMLSIARTLKKTGYRPKHTLRFCAFAAEEWGVVNSKYDWSSGAYAQLFRARPEWRGTTRAALNFELPACRYGEYDAVHCVYEYNRFFRESMEEFPLERDVFPEGVRVFSPVETWSDDFTLAVSGIPSSVNDFSDSEFMTTTYHSQFDNDENYDEDVYRFHHVLYGCLAVALDARTLPPLDFSARFKGLKESLRKGETDDLRELFAKAEEVGTDIYEKIQYLGEGECAKAEGFSSELLEIFRLCEDAFVRLNWDDEVKFPHEIFKENIRRLQRASELFGEGKASRALSELYAIDNNRYAFGFEKAVFTYFTQYVLEQPPARLQWGAGRVICHESLFDLIDGALAAHRRGETDFSGEARECLAVSARLEERLRSVLEEEERAAEKILIRLRALSKKLGA